MSSDVAAKLTKKQRKSAAFRDRKKKQPKASDKVADIPEQEDQDLVEASVEEDDAVAPVISLPKTDKKGKGKAKDEGHELDLEEGTGAAPVQTKKRKRSAVQEEGEDAQDTSAEPTKSTKRKRNMDDNQDNGRRMILFLGNLKYTTSKEQIAQHFSSCDPPPAIRLLTPKPKPGAPPPSKAVKSKGCAFLEFSTKQALQQGLRLHHSVIDGRQINVELTAGGGGNSETRISKLKERNKELHGQRAKAAEKRKEKKAEDPAEEIAQLTAGKRYSATSGVEQAPTNKRTWTVGDVVEDETHRGGVKHSKKDRKRGTRVKSHASGMNAIPVG